MFKNIWKLFSFNYNLGKALPSEHTDMTKEIKHNEYDDIFKNRIKISYLNNDRENLLWLVKFSIETANISKARGAELLGVSLIDMDEVLEKVEL